MPTPSTRKVKEYRFRAKIPMFFRIGAIAATAVAILTVVASFYNERSKSPFKLKSEHASLSTDVTAEISNYERLETEDGVAKYYIKADFARTFSDNHQELRNAYIEVYNADSSTDKMQAEKALYVPDEDDHKLFTAYLNGNVHIDTHDDLRVTTNNLVYTRRTEIAEADETVNFEWKSIKGSSLGATVRLSDKHLDLPKDVEFETFESPELARSNVRYAKVNAGTASFDRANDRVDLTNAVTIDLTSNGRAAGTTQTSNITASRSTILFTPQPKAKAEPAGAGSLLDTSSAQIRTLEFFENVHIVSSQTGQQPTNIDSGYALYDKPADRFELKNGAHIVTVSHEKPTDIKAGEAVYERAAAKISLTGSVEISQAADYIKGDAINATLWADNGIKDAVVRGNAFAKQTTPQRTSTIEAPELNASFDETRTMKTANAIGASTASVIPDNDPSYTRVDINATAGIGMTFKGAGLIDAMRTDGRTTLQLNAPNNKPDAANKRITADTVKTTFAQNGKDISSAEAVGNAELYVEPLSSGPKAYRTTINAPRFDCDFFVGNNAKTCVAGRKARVNRVPTVAQAGRGNQVLTGDQLTARFGEATHDVDIMEAVDNVKYSEDDRNAIGKQMTFTASDQMVRIRGGEPTVWDSRARAKASEIDLDSAGNRSYLRGGVSTTYYSAKQMKGSTPFGSSDKPVFVTSDTAEFDQNTETALFSRNARGWQENNYIRGDKLFIDQRNGKLEADGGVQSAVYNARMRGRRQQADGTVPVYAAAGHLTYERDKRILHYRDSVDIRQGTDRITAGVADVLLDDKNELSSTVAENNVVITQPGRRATGEWVQYTAGDETAIIRGNPASVSDAENGASQASQISFNMRDNKMVSESKPKTNAAPGRIRSVYKVKPN